VKTERGTKKPGSWLRAAGWLLACAAAQGCASEGINSASSARPSGTLPIPLGLRGENTVVHLEFPKGAQSIDPGQFQRDEVCYLKAGAFRIDCYADGSSLNLGPNDSNDLLTDNPGWALEPEDGDERATQMMRLNAVLTLVAGSVDRLPSALSDYIQSPGQHLSQALDLAESLLNEPRVRLQGFAQGGNFTATVELSDAGREKLQEALDEMGDASGQLQLVGAGAKRSSGR
jgi:hypothetical protein